MTLCHFLLMQRVWLNTYKEFLYLSFCQCHFVSHWSDDCIYLLTPSPSHPTCAEGLGKYIYRSDDCISKKLSSNSSCINTLEYNCQVDTMLYVPVWPQPTLPTSANPTETKLIRIVICNNNFFYFHQFSQLFKRIFVLK